MNGWSVSIEQTGRGGRISYREGENEACLDWEFGGGDTVAFVFGPRPEHWDAVLPWARGRRPEVMHRIAQEVIRLQAPRCRAEFEDDFSTIVIKG